MAQKILLVEDDANLGSVLTEYLELKGYDVTHCADGERGRTAFDEREYDLCILDVMLPVMDGFTLGRHIRSKNTEVPIIFLTAKSMKEDRLEGFEIGADDYVTKPFSIEELMMRVRAILKRTQVQPALLRGQNYHVGEYVFDSEQRTLVFGDEMRQLTHKESELLKYLCSSCGLILKRSDILKHIWGDDSYFNGRSMDVFVTRLRKYLKNDPNVQIINVHGMGFKLTVVGAHSLIQK
ncbi:MAG: response regulator transcription factor [Candidatus Kapabacteria bacterium]|nr:response regulator transcription factor [Candidatus Kapabacteria bacterium]